MRRPCGVAALRSRPPSYTGTRPCPRHCHRQVGASRRPSGGAARFRAGAAGVLTRVTGATGSRLNFHGIPSPRPQRPDHQRDRLRQLAHPRFPGRGGRGHRLRPGRPRRRHHHLRHRRRLRARPAPSRCSAGRSRASAARVWRSSPRSSGRPAPAATTAACRASTSWSRSTARCAGCRPTTSTSTRRTATTGSRRWRRRWRRSPTWCTPARRTTSASPSGPRTRSGTRARARPRAAHPAGLQPAAVLDAVAGHRGRGRPGLRGAGHRPDRLVADRPGRADRQVPAGPAAAGGLAGHRRQGRREHDQPLHAGRRAGAGAAAAAARRPRPGSRWPSWPSPGCCRTRNVSAAIIGASRPEQVGENVKAAGVRLEAELMARIDEILAPVAVTDPLKTHAGVPASRP